MSRTRLVPTPGMLVISPLPEETMTKAGLHLVHQKETSSYVGEVIAYCPPADDPEDYFKVGQHVVIGKWAGTEVSVRKGIKTNNYLLVNEDSILAILEEEAEDGTE
jgi:co-chaperonin GroES (HSP10)